MANILGVGSNPDQGTQGLQDFFDSSGGQFLLNQGLDSTDAFYRAKGLGQSGAEAKGLENYRSGLASTKLQDYFGNLSQLFQGGLSAGSLIGQTATQTGKAVASPSPASVIGSLLSAISDRRLKKDIVKLGEIENGLPWYNFRYLWDAADAPLREGLMSDDVRKVRPQAVVTGSSGFDRVIYPIAMGV
jgi:hypothetical protein